ncbi:MAG: FHA domain-containing protein [Kofleriaceae bacterium]
MARCALCSLPASHGVLCDGHRKAIVIGDLTPEQLVSRRAAGAAGLIDRYGAVWALGPATVVGRVLAECDLTILHASVSATHAQLEQAGPGRWRVVDRASTNGTYVDGVRVEAAPLTDGARVRFGEIEFYFVDRSMPTAPAPSGPGRTAPSRLDRIVFSASVQLATGDRVELAQRVEGGVVRIGQARVELARLEFRLLQVLAEARQAAPTADLSYLTWSAVAELLEFRSYGADGENVRELVRRVRKKLNQVGIADLIESRHGQGYRLAGDCQEA